jgi:hypothetical protein
MWKLVVLEKSMALVWANLVLKKSVLLTAYGLGAVKCLCLTELL